MPVIERQLCIQCDIDEAWHFISRPENLNRITPPDMHFDIVSDIPETMYNGLLIEYAVRLPLLGRSRWVSEIKHIREGQSFVDEQRIGPYKLWYHYHEIAPSEQGVVFTDRVNYELPFGIFGAIAHVMFVRRNLKRIFDFRETALQKIGEKHELYSAIQ